jgi:hypothetical protein
MAGYRCPTCKHPVPPAAWAEATSLSEAVLGRNVQSEWIEMRRCPGCQLLLRRAAHEQWQAAPAHLIAALDGVRDRREQRATDAAHPPAEPAHVRPAAREPRNEARAQRAGSPRIKSDSEHARRAAPSRQAGGHGRLATRT